MNPWDILGWILVFAILLPFATVLIAYIAVGLSEIADRMRRR